ncbi:helix-turn-helix domain-containing protein [Priestia megaterium]|uniref:helix-turn-helix domain-containing protein n=1 Tax=Priestia megaterium TaxID=1404 RepID=UPI002FFE25E2
MTRISGTGIRSKGKEKKNFEQVEVGLLNNYLKLGLISSNDLNVYLFLLKHDNDKHGYAYPNVAYIALETGIGEKTVKKCTNNLEQVGLIRKGKYVNHPNKNIYFVDLPLSEEALFSQVPELVEKYKLKKVKVEYTAAIDKSRLTEYVASVKTSDDDPALEAEAVKSLNEKMAKLSAYSGS